MDWSMDLEHEKSLSSMCRQHENFAINSWSGLIITGSRPGNYYL